MNDALLSVKQVSAATSLSRVSIHRLRRAGLFPPPVKVSAGRVAWKSADVQAWIDARPSLGDPATANVGDPDLIRVDEFGDELARYVRRNCKRLKVSPAEFLQGVLAFRTAGEQAQDKTFPDRQGRELIEFAKLPSGDLMPLEDRWAAIFRLQRAFLEGMRDGMQRGPEGAREALRNADDGVPLRAPEAN